MKIENIEYPTISQSAMIPHTALITLAASLCEHYGLAHQSGRVDDVFGWNTAVQN